MIFQLLKPLGLDFLNFVDGLPSQALGKKVTFFKGGDLEDFENYQLAIIGVADNRGTSSDTGDVVDLSKVRKAFYSLFPGNWNTKLIDLGDIVPGATLEDTYFLVKEVVAVLLKNKVLPIVLGGSQDLTYAVYRAYDQFEQMVNLVAIDHKLDLAKDKCDVADSYLSKIIMDEPNNLFNYSNLGYQTYFNSQEEIDLIDNLYFEAYRVGEIANDLTTAEPVLRDADIVSVDMGVVKSSDSGNFSMFNPNGFDGREICALARYSGLSDRISSFGIFNCNNQPTEALLIGQIIWYFVEGFNYRYKEYPFVNKESYFKYIVPIEGYDELIFYRSDVSGRWWVEVLLPANGSNNMTKGILLPCTHNDYLQATQQEVPERWWRMLKKSLV
ncbi:MAG: formimidoylglutamase [Flavobacteriaceae bacterium]|jgi:arginase family enzyme|nr:formimidoylglutamase [Flavobacteriaceae bacterium]